MTENADVDNSITLLQEQLDLMVRRNSVTNVEEYPVAVDSVVSGLEGHYNWRRFSLGICYMYNQHLSLNWLVNKRIKCLMTDFGVIRIHSWQSIYTFVRCYWTALIFTVKFSTSYKSGHQKTSVKARGESVRFIGFTSRIDDNFSGDVTYIFASMLILDLCHVFFPSEKWIFT